MPLKNLRYDLIKQMHDGLEKKAEKKKFHKERIKSKLDLATFGALLIEEIMANPDLTKKELITLIDQEKNDLDITNYQIKALKKLVNEYTKRRKSIKELKAKKLKPEQIFKKFFNKNPHKKIKIIFGPITTHFILHEIDYRSVALNKNSAGEFSPFKPRITIGRATYPQREQKIRTHEETHALKDFIDTQLGLNKFDHKLSKKIEELETTFFKTKDFNDLLPALKK